MANTGSKLKGKDPEIAIHGGIKIQKIVETALNGYLGQGDGGVELCTPRTSTSLGVPMSIKGVRAMLAQANTAGLTCD